MKKNVYLCCSKSGDFYFLDDEGEIIPKIEFSEFKKEDGGEREKTKIEKIVDQIGLNQKIYSAFINGRLITSVLPEKFLEKLNFDPDPIFHESFQEEIEMLILKKEIAIP